ncbi:MAG: exodeoxyribonuclease VII small subunit [Bacilli bacterium]
MKEETFESAIKKLEIITKELEQGEINLDESLKKYKEANELMTFCTKKLKDAEESINKVIDVTK